MKKSCALLWVLLAVVLPGLSSTLVRAQELIVNGGFEKPAISPYYPHYVNYGAGSAAISGWTIVSGDVDIVHLSDDQCLDLNGWGPGEIAQRVFTWPGSATLSFVWVQGSRDQMQVLWNGTVLQPAVGSGGGEVHYVMTTGDDLLSFRSVIGGPSGIYLDQISLHQLCTTGPLTIATQPASQTVFMGKTANFVVQALGACPISYQWEHDGVPIPGATSASLSIPAVRIADGGTYRVVASNMHGSVTSDSATLTVMSMEVRADSELLMAGRPVLRDEQSVITMRTYFPSGSIFFTTDGTEPSYLSSRYSAPFSIASSATVRAIAYSADFAEAQECGPYEVRIVPFVLHLVSGVNGQGEITRLPDRSLYPAGEEVTLIAAPAVGWRFRGWARDATGSTPTAVVNMDADKNVVAIFDPISVYSLRTTTAGGGVVEGNSAGDYPEGAVVELQAVAATGWQFMHWKGDATGDTATLRVIMDRVKSVEAVFGTALATTTTGGGTVQLNPALSVYPFGSKVWVSGVPESGKFLAAWGNALSGSLNPASFTVVAAHPTISALFAPIPAGQILLAVAVNGGGSVTLNPPRNLFTPGESVTLTAVGNANWVFEGWSGAVSSTDATITLGMIDSQLVTADFVTGLRLKTRVDGLGTIEVDPNLPSYRPGQSVQISVHPEPLWGFSEWSGDVSGTTSPISIVMDDHKSVIAILRASPGAKLWESQTLTIVESSPAIGADGTVYVGSWDGIVHAFDGVTGAKRWETGTGPFIRLSPAIGADGTIYIGSDDGKLYALDKATGRRRWECVVGVFTSSPAVSVYGTIYVGSSDGNLYALDGLTGRTQWTFLTGSYVNSSPAIGSDGTVYVGSYDQKVYALDGVTGAKRWEFLTGNHINASSPAIGADGTVYVGSYDRKVYALDGVTGAKRWEFLTGGEVHSSPAIGSDGTVYVGSYDQKVYALDGVTGAKRWEFFTGGWMLSCPAIGSDGAVYVGSLDQKVYALDGVTGAKRWEFLTGGKVGSSAAVGADGIVYVGSRDGKLYALVGGTALAESPWPMFHQNAQHTGRIGPPAPNVAPTLDPIAGQSVDEGEALSVQCWATDPDDPDGALTWALVAGPDGATINGSTGLIGWVPGEAGGPGVHDFTVRVTDSGNPPLSAERAFAVTVNELNEPPQMGSLSNRTMVPGELLEVQPVANDADVPANTLTWSLVSGPEGMAVDSVSGLLRWTPTVSQAGQAYAVTVRVADNGVPVLSDEESFQVEVETATEQVVSGVRWEVLPKPTTEVLYSVTYGAGLFVAVGTGGTILSSPDGEEWTLRSSGTGGALMGVTYVGSQFVAIGQSQTYMTSPDGLTWEARQTGQAVGLLDLAYGAGKYVAVGANGAILTSPDGFPPWTKQVVGTTKHIYDVTFANGLFMGACQGGQIVTSPDGLTWTVRESGTSVELAATGYADGEWWVAGASGTVLTSSDLTQWTPVSVGDTTFFLSFGQRYGRYLLLGGDWSDPVGGVLLVSKDGQTWQKITSLAFGRLHDAVFADGRWVLVGKDGTILRSMELLPPWGLELASVGNGSVTVDPAQATYADGSSVTLTAVPAANHLLAGWSGDAVGTQNPLTLVMNTNKALIATFVEQPSGYALTLQVVGDGTVTAHPAKSLYEPGETVQLQAEAAAGWVLADWSGDAAGVTDTVSVTMDRERTVTARFQARPVLASIVDQNIGELQTLDLIFSATDADGPVESLRYSVMDAPEGASVDAQTGAFHWTPSEVQGSRVYPITVVVTDSGSPALSNSATFTVVVAEVNAAPELGPIGPRTVLEGNLLQVPLTAADSDIAPNALTYALVSGPAGLELDALTATLRWRPVIGQGGQVFPVTVQVTDNGVPPMNDQETFDVTVETNLDQELSGIRWEVVTKPTSEILYSVTYGAGLYVAVGTGGTILTSPDGADWTLRSSGPGGALMSVTYAGGQFVTMGQSQTYLTSPDGVVWQTRQVGQAASIIDLAYGAGRYVAVGPGGTILTSPGGLPPWTKQAIATSNHVYDVTFADGRFVAACQGGHVAISADGETWEVRDVVVPIDLAATGCVDGRWWVAGASGTVLTSTDLSQWTPVPVGDTGFLISFAGRYGRYLLLGGAWSDPFGDVLLVSKDGVNWQKITSLTGPQLSDAVFADGRWVVVGVGGRILRSTELLPPWGLELASVGNGSVTVDPAQATYADGSSVTLTAVPAVNHLFTGWSGDATAAANPLTLVMDTNKTVTATFTPDPTPYALTIQIAGQGTVDAVPARDRYAPGEPVELTAQPAAGWAFADWSGEATGSDPTVTLTMNASSTVTARFQGRPVLASIADEGIGELQTLGLTFTATDPDSPVESLRYAISEGPEGATVNAETGVFQWTPREDQGPGGYPITVVVTDFGTPPLSGSATFTVTVNEVNTAPSIDAVTDQAVAEGDLLELRLMARDGDIPANALRFEGVTGPSGMGLDLRTGQLWWRPKENQGGNTYAVEVRVVDDGTPPLSGLVRFNLRALELNTRPELAAVPAQQAKEGEPWAYTLVASDADLPANTLTFRLLSGPEGLTIDPALGIMRWVPGADMAGAVVPVVAEVQDDGIPPLSRSVTFNIAVAEANSPPELAFIPDQQISELSELQVVAVASDADIPAQQLTFSLVDPPGGASIDPVTGLFRWTPSEAQGPGTYQVTIKVTDNGSPVASASRTFNVRVDEVNTAPVLRAVSDQGIDEGMPWSTDASAVDVDQPANVLTYSLVGATSGMHIDSASGRIEWTPTEMQGPLGYVVTVRVFDNGDPARSDTRAFNLTVREVNRAPRWTLSPGSAVVDEGTPLATLFQAVDDDWPVNTLTYSLEGAPAWASINPGTGALQWTPTEDQGPSQQTMTVVATDNSEPPARVTATFQVTVNEVNTAPRLAEIADRTVTLGESVSFTATATDEDRPANMLTFSLVSPPAGASIDPLEGLFNWSPDASQVGAHSITVQVADNGLPEMRQSETFQVTVVRTLEVTWEVSGGELVLRIRTLSGRTYRVEYQDNGIIGTWQVLVDNVAGNGALKSVSEPITTLVKERFYRAVELP